MYSYSVPEQADCNNVLTECLLQCHVALRPLTVSPHSTQSNQSPPLCLTIMFIPALMLVLPALSLSATELLLEPSGGKAILVDSSLLTKRDAAPTQQAVDSQDSPQVVREENVKQNAQISHFQPVEKRAAILLDKIMYAVQKALDEDRAGKGSGGQHGNVASFTSVSH